MQCITATYLLFYIIVNYLTLVNSSPFLLFATCVLALLNDSICDIIFNMLQNPEVSNSKLIAATPADTVSSTAVIKPTRKGPMQAFREKLVDPVRNERQRLREKFLYPFHIRARNSAAFINEQVLADYRSASLGGKVIMASAASLQLADRLRLGLIYNVPWTIDVYENTGGSQVAAGAFLAGAFYAQQYAASGAWGVAGRLFPGTTQAIAAEFPRAENIAARAYAKRGRGIGRFIRESISPIGVGTTLHQTAELVGNPTGTAEDSLRNGDRISRRAGIAAGGIALGLLSAAEQWPTNPFVTTAVREASQVENWVALGLVLEGLFNYGPAIVAQVRENRAMTDSLEAVA